MKQHFWIIFFKVKLEKVDDDEDDIEVDVDLSDEDDSKVQHIKENIEETIHKKEKTDVQRFTGERVLAKSVSKVANNLSKLDDETFHQISSLEIPKCELVLESYVISKLEKVINWDYFEGRQSKTPQRYLKVSQIFKYFLLESLIRLFFFVNNYR